MKLKEIDRTANVAWSPASQHPIYIAAATAAQQLDATFNTSSLLELYQIDLGDPSFEMEVSGSIPTESRLHKLVWSSAYTSENGDTPDLLIGGAEQGKMYIWNPSKILRREEPLTHLMDLHTGAVAALDVNPFQPNLLVSGAGSSEIYIWDLNDPDNPMTPGSKAQPLVDVTHVGWNKQVQHILASSHSGNCVVWDLRKNEPIIKIRDSMSRIKCNTVCWHPDVATQLCIASEDDHSPVIQVWDLRSASSPIKILENHTRGILSMSWCVKDADLLLSCAKDNRILCWNPNSEAQHGDVVYELPNSNQWCFDVQWCPRNPSIISGCSFDGHVSIYSIMGGQPTEQTTPKVCFVADAFQVDPFNQPTPHHAVPPVVGTMLKKAPKWLKRPCGANFGFGGKLVCFNNTKVPGSNPLKYAAEVTISQVVTEYELVVRSQELERALTTNMLLEFCDRKIEMIDRGAAGDTIETREQLDIWKFLKVGCLAGCQQLFLNLLGHDGLKKYPLMTSSTRTTAGRNETEEDLLKVRIYIYIYIYICVCVCVCVSFDYIAENQVRHEPLIINTDATDGTESQITECLLTGNFEAAVSVCLEGDYLVEAMILAVAGGNDLLIRTQAMILERKKSSKLHRLMALIINRDIERIVDECDVGYWKEVLTIILTYAPCDQFHNLCGKLARKLEDADSNAYQVSAQLCCIVAGDVDQFVNNWKKQNGNNTVNLQLLQVFVFLFVCAVVRCSLFGIVWFVYLFVCALLLLDCLLFVCLFCKRVC
ncbi:hypothetical protein HELRODRAFT_112302 [Helobdella robusta]|uniref:Uncharacterized protein n=1 Tax=Helobdella robusta TaxID=6412 RepID=T1EFI4_HELRO|nr:hypothetical protein HELRODRAFT_112302 [Helobdella robusta]ESO03422.1 hypothetical protein HELRODRAFT_112302 [Helobdella robusta]